MRVPICLFEKEDLVYLRDRLGPLRTRNGCLVFTSGEWRRVLNWTGAGLSESAKVQKRLSLRLSAEFMEQRKRGADRSTLFRIVESVIRLEPEVGEWMLARMDDSKHGIMA